jgi:hypothetical protein
MKKAEATPLWKKKRKNTSKPKQKMPGAQVARARARAEEAGRPYPNLIDNMAILREDRKFLL